MSEAFLCKGEWVEFSNLAATDIFEGWFHYAFQLGYKDLAQYMPVCGGFGGRAFGIDSERLDDEDDGDGEFFTFELKCQWLEVMDQLIADIKSNGPYSVEQKLDALTEENKNSWLERLYKMRDALDVQVNPEHNT